MQAVQALGFYGDLRECVSMLRHDRPLFPLMTPVNQVPSGVT